MNEKSWLEDSTVKRWFRNLSERTQKNYTKQFPRWLGFINESPDEMITKRKEQVLSKDESVKRFYEDKVIAFKCSLEGKDIKIPTVKAYLRTAMSFFSQNHYPLVFAKKELKVESSEKDKVVSEWIPNREEVKILYRTCESATQRSLLLVLYQSGFSEIDVHSMKIEQFPFYDENGKWQCEDNDLYHARLREKTSELQQTCISREAIEEIKLMLQSRGFPKKGYLFVSTTKAKGKALSTEAINGAIKTIVLKAFNGRVREWQTKHLRNSYMNALQQAKIPTELKDAMVGHKRSGSKASYGISEQTIRQLYAEAFPFLTVNGFGTQTRKIEELELKMREDKQALTDLITEQQKKISDLEFVVNKTNEALDLIATELEKYADKLEQTTKAKEKQQPKT